MYKEEGIIIMAYRNLVSLTLMVFLGLCQLLTPAAARIIAIAVPQTIKQGGRITVKLITSSPRKFSTFDPLITFGCAPRSSDSTYPVYPQALGYPMFKPHYFYFKEGETDTSKGINLNVMVNDYCDLGDVFIRATWVGTVGFERLAKHQMLTVNSTVGNFTSHEYNQSPLIPYDGWNDWYPDQPLNRNVTGFTCKEM